MSPIEKTFNEIVAKTTPMDAFTVELNVPKALAGVVFEIPPGQITFEGYHLAVVVYKTPYPGTDPDRFRAFMLTPEDSLKARYPVLSDDDFALMRREEERYFTSLMDASHCHMAARERKIAVHEIPSHEFGSHTAQEMIDYFTQLDAASKETK